MTISNTTIIADFERCLKKAKYSFPVERWAHPVPTLRLSSLARDYGQTETNGTVTISTAFIGTDSVAKLNETIVHELAHIIAGLQCHHNKDFQRIHSILMQGKKRAGAKQIQAVKDKAPFKYRLLAYTKDNRVLDLGGAYRRTQRYTGYTGNHSFRGVSVTRYEYVGYKDPLPEGVVQDQHL